MDATAFVPIRLMLQVPLNPGPELENFGYDIAETFDTGLLRYGNGNPSSPDYDSLADFCVNGDDIEIRLPWLLLNFSNPSEMMVHDDYYLHYGVEEMSIEGIYVGAASEKSVRKDVQMAGEVSPPSMNGCGRGIMHCSGSGRSPEPPDRD